MHMVENKQGKYARLLDSRSVQIEASPEQVFKPIERIGGDTGWYFANWLWGVRCFIDRLVGGDGCRQRRPHPQHLSPGDRVSCWRVEAIEPNRLLRLAAVMKLPGRAWLQFEVEANGSSTILRQTAIFDPDGLFGWVYWYALYPIHKLVFAGMLRGIARAVCGRGT